MICAASCIAVIKYLHSWHALFWTMFFRTRFLVTCYNGDFFLLLLQGWGAGLRKVSPQDYEAGFHHIHPSWQAVGKPPQLSSSGRSLHTCKLLYWQSDQCLVDNIKNAYVTWPLAIYFECSSYESCMQVKLILMIVKETWFKGSWTFTKQGAFNLVVHKPISHHPASAVCSFPALSKSNPRPHKLC